MRAVRIVGCMISLVILAVVLACRLDVCLSSLDWSYVGAVGIGCVMVVVMLCSVMSGDDVD